MIATTLYSHARLLFARQATSGGSQSGSTGDEFLDLVSSPFDSEFSSNSFLSALAFSIPMTVALTLAFCFLRPYNNVVYAPRAKHADSKHAPPRIEKGLFSWVKTLMRTKEADLVEKAGLDAAIFMRFTRMMRNIFSILTVIGCGILIPTVLVSADSTFSDGAGFFNRLTPVYMYGSSGFWSYVVCAYLFDAVIFYFLWTNYRAVLRMRRAYLDSKDYQRSLHSRTLLLTDIPNNLRSDEGIVRITEEVKASGDTPRAAIARNVKDLPELIEEHEEAVKKLESVLAKYLKDPDHLPAKRPTCKASKKDQAYTAGQEVDAIEYLTARIKTLETEIKEVRLSVDKRNAMSFGFATYEDISTAHNVAYVSRKKAPEGSIIRLAPKPNDLIWKNLPMLKKQRNWQNFINNLWVALLTVAWIVPNILIAVFLSNLSHLGQVWEGFQETLYAHPTFWAIVQGIVAPAITTLFYYFLPSIFRQLATKAGDVTRTGRERHVMHKLFSFFLLNNLIVFSLFSAAWGFIAAVIGASEGGADGWDAVAGSQPVGRVVTALITVAPYWCSWLLQRNLGAAIDLSQFARLTWGSFSRRYLHPTPREVIELTAPQPFEYAAYYNYFLFYAAVTLCFGGLQPLTLAITALYFWMDSFSKKYMILYIFVTKYESGGMFWRSLFNRVLICTILGNLVIALLVVAQGSTYVMVAAMAPLPFLILAFKWYCARTFDDPIHYYSEGQKLRDEEINIGGELKKRRGDRIGTRFGHPALYKPLMTPMVSAKSQHLLKQVYSGRTSLDDQGTAAGYSDVYMDTMDSNKPGKPSGNTGPFEIVNENQMDYEHWKNNPEFRDEAGELFGHPADMVRPGTPGTMMSGPTRTGTWETDRSRSQSRDPYQSSREQSLGPYDRGRAASRDSDLTRVADGGVDYPRGYHPTPTTDTFNIPGARHQDSREGLVTHAARMARSPPPQLPTPEAPAPGGFGQVGQIGLDYTPAGTPYQDDNTSYDYFRRGRSR
ncbi:hypothetical protein LTR37_006807 [Vermiconidia calcicola]|uniref:Uncharacterized protein n=1 Tax=Vermiconidia calcicola TaxID=1690605 RepID=A0ACC3NG92_9PEZI|nr:hypothetical protein LTR37_006807 [Vermiconidia calcicola]